MLDRQSALRSSLPAASDEQESCPDNRKASDSRSSHLPSPFRHDPVLRRACSLSAAAERENEIACSRFAFFNYPPGFAWSCGTIPTANLLGTLPTFTRATPRRDLTSRIETSSLSVLLTQAYFPSGVNTTQFGPSPVGTLPTNFCASKS